MDASSPRSIQHAAAQQSPAVIKHLNASPLSSPTAPSSYNSELDKDSSTQLHHASDHSPFFASAVKPCTTPTHAHSVSCSEAHNVQHSSPQSSSCSSGGDVQDHLTSSNRSWLSALLATKFYGLCPKHADFRKNDLNLFCITHAVKICQFCHHADHSQKNGSGGSCKILHVSRYMYHDVLLAKEASVLLDLENVQSYLNNGNRVVYMDRRAQAKSRLAPNAKACIVCSRTLQDPFLFCSVFCRLAHAKDPAAISSLPVPDASPLLQQAVRKPKPPMQNSPSNSKRTERHTKKFDKCLSIPLSQLNSPSTPRRSSVCPSSPMSPSLPLVDMKKRSRRKTEPVRSPTGYVKSVFLLDKLPLLI